MEEKDNDRGGYYRAIAKEFLRRRGAPYFLSPRDLALIEEWEEAEIPLTAVLEGIEAAFERRKGRRGRDGIRALASCASAVRRAHAQHRDRRAGGRRTPASRAAKRDLAKKEVERFILGHPDDAPELKALYERGLGILSDDNPDEGLLEALDEEMDELLWAGAGRAEKETWERTASREFGVTAARGLERIARSLFVKASRAERKIPYLSLFYY